MDQGKKSFIALVFVFLAPVLLGTLVFFNKEKLGLGGSTVNYGTLITPVIPLNTQGLSEYATDAEKSKIITKKWTLLYIALDSCDTTCKERLLLMKNVRLLMNEDMRRIRTTLVSADNTLQETLKTDYPDLVFARIDTSTTPFLSQFKHKAVNPIYLIDPLGNLMMFYPQTKSDHKLMIKDLKRLLKYSRVG